jgi:hypothetical protein
VAACGGSEKIVAGEVELAIFLLVRMVYHEVDEA